MKATTIVALTLIALAAAAAAFIYSGSYPIGADTPHWGLTAEAIQTLRERSIATQLEGITPPNLEDPRLIAIGADHYAEMCTGCHLAPGMADTEVRAGLYPQPPNLSERAETAQDPHGAARRYWIIKHGLKLTAMPAWGKTHDDEAIWGLVAFLQKLPGLTPEQYAQATAEHDDTGEDHPAGVLQEHGAAADRSAHEHAHHHHD